jgi:membrane protein implicated in regulation of membrane protease activity
MRLATLKLVLAIAGIVLFLAGVRTGLTVLRWAGIAVVAAAFLLRFLPRREPREP